MKKNKEKHQHTPEPTTAGESKISSTTLTLQSLNKEKEKNKETEKNESAAEAAKVRCRTCFKEVAPERLCSGHGGGTGESASSSKASEEKTSSDENKSLSKTHKIIETTDEMPGEFSSEEFDSESDFAPEIVAELIAKGLLLVDRDREFMTLTLKESKVLTEEQREELNKFVEAIIKEFNTFKEENHLPDNCMKIAQNEKGNIVSLQITIPTLALYDAFIQQLANNLVPISSAKAQEKTEAIKDQGLAPNPLSREPKPSNQGIETKKVEEEEQELFNPSPFNMRP